MALSHIAFFYGTVEEAYLQKIRTHLDVQRVSFFPIHQLLQISHDHFSHFVVCGTLEEIKTVFYFASQESMSVGIVPLPEQKRLMRTFALPSQIEKALVLATTSKEERIDLMLCNNEIVLQEVVVGEAPPLDTDESTLLRRGSFARLSLFWHTLQRVGRLHHRRMSLIDENEKRISISAVGVVALEYHNGSFASRLISSQIHAADGKLSLLILAPVSMVQYMGYLLQTLIPRMASRTLPRSLGYIRASALRIETEEVLPVRIDGTVHPEENIVLRVEERGVALSVGDAFWERQNEEVKGKNSAKVDHLPNDEESAAYLRKSIPFFTHASQQRYAALFSNLREEAKFTSMFATLLILATMIATFGLFIDSASVIIGAMLLAPLMQPIVSLSMGVLRQDSVLEVTAAKTIGTGVSLVLLTAMLIAWFTPIGTLSTEMAGRLSPTLLDLCVAMVSGAAAAYAKSNEKIVSSLAGVAIAVALVPPIAVAGIGMGWGVWHIFSSAFLLFLTNLVGIVLAAALTFVFLGFSPIHVAKKGVAIWVVIALLIAMPLYRSFETMSRHAAIKEALTNRHIRFAKDEAVLSHIELVRQPKVMQVRCEVITKEVLGSEEKRILKEKIAKAVGMPVEVIATFRYRL